MITFAAVVLGMPLDPWQQWLVIHLGELLPDGRPRFRRVVVIVARQNGKTHLCRVLALFWIFVEKWPMVFGTHTDLDKARESWQDALDAAESVKALSDHLPRRHTRNTNGQQSWWTTWRSKYKIGAANRKGGRGLTVDRAIGDELREQLTWAAYGAVMFAMNLRPKAQLIYITNMGDDRSVVLNDLRAAAVQFIEEGVGDERLGLFEWSAPPGSHPTDVHAWAAANPQLGRRMDYDTVRGPAATVARPGADPQALTTFLTEVLCMAVPNLDPAVSTNGWRNCREVAGIDLAERRRLAAVLDVAPDGQHATLAVALADAAGVVRVETVAAWDGPDALFRCRAELPGWVARVKPRKLGWFPNGPAAVLDAELRDRRREGRGAWPPRGVEVAELKAETPAVCMAFASLVDARMIRHSGQKLLDAHVESAEKDPVPGGRWVFNRPGAGHVDAAYAAAGAVHLARTMPTPRRVSGTAHTA